MEYLDLYDSNKNLTGKKIVRDKKIISELKDSYINVVLIFIKRGFVKSGSNSINTVCIEF